ncbi:MAG: outer spore coat protein CotE, partial [Kurthia gibsonii]
MFTQWALPAYDGVKRVEGGIALKRLRQIVTKAVVAKGKKRTEERVTLCPTN